MAISIGTVFSLAGAVGRLIDGSPPGVKIGTILLDGIEAPEKMAFGGQQQMTIHNLPGGVRIVDAMGQSEADLQFSGFFDGPGAHDKAKALDGMRRKGGVWRLSWSDQVRRVIIKDYSCDYQYAGQWMPYRLTCVVLLDKNDRPPTSASSIGQDIAKALGLGAITPILTAAQGYLAQAQQILPLIGIVAPRLAGTIAGFSASAGGILQGAASLSEGKLSGFSVAGGAVANIYGNLGGAAIARSRNLQTSAASDMAAAVTAQAYAGRAAANARSQQANG